LSIASQALSIAMTEIKHKAITVRQRYFFRMSSIVNRGATSNSGTRSVSLVARTDS
jgi:hypothetical protein